MKISEFQFEMSASTGYWSTGFSVAEVKSAGEPLTEKKNDQTELDRLRKEHEEDLCKLSYLNRQSVLESSMRLEVQKTKSMEEMYLKIINELKSEIQLKDLELAKLRKENDVKSALGSINTLPSNKTNASTVPEIILIDDDQYLNMDNWVKKRFMEGYYPHGFTRQDWYPDSQWYDERKAHTIQRQIRDIMTYFLLRQEKASFILVSGSGPKYRTLFEGERRNAFEYSVTSNGITKEWKFH